MSEVLEKLVVKIETDQRKLRSEMSQMKGDMKKQGATLGKSFSSGFSGMLKGLGTTIVATQVLSFVKKSIALYGIQEAAEKRLEVAYGKNTDALKEYASALQAQTAYGDEAIIDAEALIAAFVKDEDAIKRATKATLDLAAAKGMDLKVAADLLSKTLGSSTNALSRYGIEVKGAVGSSERLDSAMESLNEKFGGQAEAQLDTYTGKVQALSNAWGDLLEKVGKGSLETIFAGVQTLFSGGGSAGLGMNMVANQMQEEFAKIAREADQEFKNNLPKAVEKTIVTISSLEEEIKKLGDELKTTDITDLVSRDRIQKMIEGKKQIIENFLNPIKEEIQKTFGEIKVKGLDIQPFGSKTTPSSLKPISEEDFRIYEALNQDNAGLEEQKSLWEDIGQAQQYAMGSLISNWSSAIKLFDKANSMLQQFLNTLTQVAFQQVAISAIGSFSGGGILGYIGDAVNSILPKTSNTESGGGLNKSSGLDVTNTLLIENNQLQTQILNKTFGAEIDNRKLLISTNKAKIFNGDYN